MQILKPVTLTASDISFTNATANAETAWVPGTYAAGTKRYVGMVLYQVSASVTSTNGIPGESPDWIVIGNINPYKCLDGKVGTVTTSTTNSMTISVQTASLINGGAFLNMDAGQIEVRIIDSVEGEVYSYTETLLEDVENWWQFFFLPYERKVDVILTDFPTYPGSTVQVVLSRTSGTVSIGELALGTVYKIGDTQFGASASIQDYSRKITDDFGNYSIEERTYSKRASYDVVIDTENFQAVSRLLSSIRTVPCVFVGDPNNDALIVYGFFRSFNMVLSNPVFSACSLQVEGL